MEKKRYTIDRTDRGYIIRDALHVMPLPFNYISRQYAEEACREFNEKGPEGVRSYYYCHKVAGAGGSHPYKKWMEQNKMMFE